jgi:hypothetical protein
MENHYPFTEAGNTGRSAVASCDCFTEEAMDATEGR